MQVRQILTYLRTRLQLKKGKVDAAETNAKASTSEATASDSGASALKTKAGATDVATKGLKLN